VSAAGPAPLRLSDGAVLLDTAHDSREGTIGSYLIPQAGDAGRAGRFDLVESGPQVDLPALEAGIHTLGLEPDGVERVLVTHIHLDHAGGAGAWAARHGATVVALAAGAEHLVDPSRLVASARRVYGDALERLWGGITPLPAAALEVVEGAQELTVGGRRVRVVATPGHARHHATFVWPDGVAYTGDAAGIRFPGCPVVRPALPPPELDLAAWDATFARLGALGLREVRLTHFGAFDDVARHLAAARERTHAWAEALLAWAVAGCDRAEAARRFDELARAELEAAGADAATVARYLATSDAAMTVAGLERYWRTQHPQRWPGWQGGHA
jgi:glyoxylase-like metal-dependent hydrolase (beta-lactamase superfamily II)